MKDVLVNPTIFEATLLMENITGNLVKTIYDDWGNVYLWDGDQYEHREVMSAYSISDELYATARRLYKDFGGVESLTDVLTKWESEIKGKQYYSGIWHE